MPEEIEVIHKELLVLLEFFHKYCIDHGIRYSLHGGTLLGAVREKGFIAWDDDADVSMDRKNYDRFCQLMKEDGLPAGFAFADQNRYPQFAMKREGAPAVWTDIFVYDYISENPIAQKLKLAGTKFFILTTRPQRDQDISNKYGYYRGFKKWLLNAFVAGCRIIPYPVRLKHAKWFMKRFPGKRTLVHRSNDTKAGMSMILPASINDEYITVPFENTELMILKDYRTVLTSSYGGSYMIPLKATPERTQMHAISYKREQEEMELLIRAIKQK